MTSPCRILAAIALAALASSGTVVHGDLIELANGQTIEGRIVSETEDFIYVETGAVRIPLRRTSIVSVRESEPWENTLLQARTAIQRGELLRAIELLRAAEAENATKDALNTLLEAQEELIRRSLTIIAGEPRTTLRMEMRRLSREEWITHEVRFMLARCLNELDDPEAARSAIFRIPPEVLRADPHRRHWTLQFMREGVRRSLNHDSFEDALAFVEAMRRLTTDGAPGEGELALAHLARCAAARDMDDFEEALRIVAEDLQPLVPEIARNRAVYTIEKMKQWAATKGSYAAARESLDPLRDVFPLEYHAARESLLALEGRELYDQGKLAEALELFDSIPLQERSADIQQLRIRAYHELRLMELEGGDPLELIRHGEWCLENDLLDEAIAIFKRTRENVALRDLSNQLIVNAARSRDTQLLDRARRLYDDGDMVETLAVVHEALQNPDLGSELFDEANRLRDLARRAMDREQQARGPRAVVEYQQAERAFFRQDYATALDYLNLILRRYPETPAARWAANLMPDVMRGLELAYLEGRSRQPPELPRDIEPGRISRSDRLDREMQGLLEAVGELR